MLIILLCAGVLAAIWAFATKPLSLLLDRYHTKLLETRPIKDYAFASGVLYFGDSHLSLMTPEIRWSGVTAALSISGRATLSADNNLFPLGAGHSAADWRGEDFFEFKPDAGDEVRFTIEQGLIPWPVFEISFIGGDSPSARRGLYSRLRWRKRSGATLEMLWRFDAGLYSNGGWRPKTLESLSNNLVETHIAEARDLLENAIAYLGKAKHWGRGDFQLEDWGPTPDGKEEIIAALRPDNQNVALTLDFTTRQVTHEIPAH